MEVEFKGKSGSKRKSIFKKRAYRIVETLVSSMESSSGDIKTPSERTEICRELVDEIYRVMSVNLEDILSPDLQPEVSQAELTKLLIERLKASSTAT